MARKSQLEEISPENLQAAAASAKQTKPAAYVSTAPVQTNDIIDTQAFEQGYMASAAAASEHLNFTGQIATLRQPLAQLKQEFNETSQILSQFQHKDTRVNIVRDKRVYKIDIPGELKAYANELDQTIYLQVMMTFLGEERMKKLRNYVIKGGQIDRPALWFNQQLYIETKMEYAFTLDRELKPELAKDLADKVGKLEEKHRGITEQSFGFAFGPQLYSAMIHIADVSKLGLYTVFMMLTDKVLELHDHLNLPAQSVNLWQSVLGNE